MAMIVHGMFAVTRCAALLVLGLEKDYLNNFGSDLYMEQK